ncbi:DNA adenine methylase, partial [Candidatus Endomicrobiellum trichonymphae]|uniref:DNA adenine methylase n=1 Tax=Endomicrobium trichonymphae TaxID=1408204 RepID=UPI0039B912C3
MNYIGSKHKLVPFLKSTIHSVAGMDLKDKVFCDIFAGTGAVGRNFKSEVRQVIANDVEYYSYVLNRNYIGNHRPLPDAFDFLRELNALPLIGNGFIFSNYCAGSGSGRQYFSDFNGKKIDAIRQKIEEWKKTRGVSEDLYFYLLASLLESADRVANTASVYGAFLKQVKKTALKELILEPADFTLNENEHQVFNKNSNELIKNITGDILYLDPPYNQRQYGSNYHMLNTIAKYETFVPNGKTGLPAYSRSLYCSSASVLSEFESLIKNASFKYIFLSYNNEGLMSVDNVKTIMQKYGKYSLAATKYQRFK